MEACGNFYLHLKNRVGTGGDLGDDALELSHFSGSEDRDGTVGYLLPNHTDATGRAGRRNGQQYLGYLMLGKDFVMGNY